MGHTRHTGERPNGRPIDLCYCARGAHEKQFIYCGDYDVALIREHVRSADSVACNVYAIAKPYGKAHRYTDYGEEHTLWRCCFDRTLDVSHAHRIRAAIKSYKKHVELGFVRPEEGE